MTVHRATEDHVASDWLVKEDMLSERREDDEEAPVAEAGMREASQRADPRMKLDEQAGAFDSIEVALGDFPRGIVRIPLELLFDVGEERGRLASAHCWPVMRARTRSRIPSKSSLPNGVAG